MHVNKPITSLIASSSFRTREAIGRVILFLRFQPFLHSSFLYLQPLISFFNLFYDVSCPYMRSHALTCHVQLSQVDYESWHRFKLPSFFRNFCNRTRGKIRILKIPKLKLNLPASSATNGNVLLLHCFLNKQRRTRLLRSPRSCWVEGQSKPRSGSSRPQTPAQFRTGTLGSQSMCRRSRERQDAAFAASSLQKPRGTWSTRWRLGFGFAGAVMSVASGRRRRESFAKWCTGREDVFRLLQLHAVMEILSLKEILSEKLDSVEI